MKTHINGHTEMATKYQLSKLYTKVQTHINLASSALSTAISGTNNQVSDLEKSLLEKYNTLLSADTNIRQTLTTTETNLQDTITNKTIQALTQSKQYTDQKSFNALSSANYYTDQTKDNLISSLQKYSDDNLLAAKKYSDDNLLSGKEYTDDAKKELKIDDVVLSGKLTEYIDKQIENLGSLYTLIGPLSTGVNATSIEQLPTDAKVGQIYFVDKVLPNGNIETEQYICVSGEIDYAVDKFQKFGTTVDLSNYLTIKQIDNRDNKVLNDAKDYVNENDKNLHDTLTGYITSAYNQSINYTNETSGKLNQILINYIDIKAFNTLSTANNYTNQTKDDLISSLQKYSDDNRTSSKTYTNDVKIELLSAINDVKDQLTEIDKYISGNLVDYVNNEIYKLGSVYSYVGSLEDGSIAKAVSDLPNNAKAGSIYLVEKTLSDGTTEIEHYISITSGISIPAYKYKKFGSSVDLSNYLTSSQVESADSAILSSADKHIHDAKIQLLSTLQNYSDNNSNNSLSSAKAYTNQVSGLIVEALQKFSTNNDSQILSDVKEHADKNDKNLHDTLTGYISSAYNQSKNFTNDIKLELLSADTNIKNDLEQYVEDKINKLGSVYTLVGKLKDGSTATDVSALPLNAQKGQIYFVEKTLSDGTIETEQYICITNDLVNYNEKYQKFGTSIDLSNYLTSSQIDKKDTYILSEANLYTDQVSGNLSTALTNSISDLAKNYTDQVSGLIVKALQQVSIDNSNNAYLSAYNYTDQISSNLSTALTKDIFSLAKDYTNQVSGNLSTALTNSISGLATKYTDNVSGLIVKSLQQVSIDNSNNAYLAAYDYANQVSGTLHNTLTGYILSAYNQSKDFTNDIKAELISADTDIKNELKQYVNDEISALGSVYSYVGSLEDGSIATNINDLPLAAKAGSIYLVEKTLSDGTIETEHYISITSGIIDAAKKYKKFGSSVDLSNYLTKSQIKDIENNILNKSFEKSFNAYLSAYNYTNQVSGNLSTALTDDIASIAKEYTNSIVQEALYKNSNIEYPIFIKQRSIVESSDKNPNYGILAGNTTYKFSNPIQSLTFEKLENSDYETLLYFTTSDSPFIIKGMPKELLYIDNGITMDNLPTNTMFIMTVRNGVAKIEKIVSLTPETPEDPELENPENGEEPENTDI